MLKEQHAARVQSWRNKHKNNIRGLLGSLHTVLWENSGWQPASMGDLLEQPQVRGGAGGWCWWVLMRGCRDSTARDSTAQHMHMRSMAAECRVQSAGIWCLMSWRPR